MLRSNIQHSLACARLSLWWNRQVLYVARAVAYGTISDRGCSFFQVTAVDLFSTDSAPFRSYHQKRVSESSYLESHAIYMVDLMASQEENLQKACLEHMGELLAVNPSLETANEAVVSSSRTSYTSNTTGTFEISIVPIEVVDKYQEACAAANGRFAQFSGRLDCVGYGEFNKNMKSTSVHEHNPFCFPRTPNCDSYSAVSWLISEARVFSSECTVETGPPGLVATTLNPTSLGYHRSRAPVVSLVAMMLVIMLVMFLLERRRSRRLRSGAHDYEMALNQDLELQEQH